MVTPNDETVHGGFFSVEPMSDNGPEMALQVGRGSLTNIRRHAADATHVEVRLRDDTGRLAVTVTDDGRGGTQLPVGAHGGGFGLVGLKERVTALDGELDAGPRDGGGWEVRAVFPTRKP